METNKTGNYDILYNGVPCFLLDHCKDGDGKPVLSMVRNADYLESAVENGFKQAATSGNVIKALQENLYKKITRLKRAGFAGLFLIIQDEVYVLNCHPAEPCTYIKNEDIFIVVHNAYDLSFLFLDGIYDLDVFYRDIVASIEYAKMNKEMNIERSCVKKYWKQKAEECCNNG